MTCNEIAVGVAAVPDASATAYVPLACPVPTVCDDEAVFGAGAVVVGAGAAVVGAGAVVVGGGAVVDGGAVVVCKLGSDDDVELAAPDALTVFVAVVVGFFEPEPAAAAIITMRTTPTMTQNHHRCQNCRFRGGPGT